MAWWRNRLLWLLGIALVAAAIWWTPGSRTPEPTTGLELPADPPDLYIRDLDQTRYDIAGQPSMRTEAEDLAYYEARELSRISTPRVLLLENGTPEWRILSRTATLFNNGDVEFEQDVEVRELDATPAMTLTTDWLRAEQDGSFVTTPRPVRLVEGNQVATGVGMDADLAASDPVITLKSEVAIRYEAVSP